MEDSLTQAAIRFSTQLGWKRAAWSATSYRCHPTGEAPPVMGLVFADCETGQQLFSSWTSQHGNRDKNGAIRVAFVEGDIEGLAPGYSIRISAEDGDEGGQVQRMHPAEDTAHLFTDFKAQYLQHGEYLLCPIVQKKDGQLWFDAMKGIIKHEAIFRNAEDIGPDDPDAVVLQPTEAETALCEMMKAANQAPNESQES